MQLLASREKPYILGQAPAILILPRLSRCMSKQAPPPTLAYRKKHHLLGQSITVSLMFMSAQKIGSFARNRELRVTIKNGPLQVQR